MQATAAGLHSETINEILSRYAPYLDACRTAIRKDLASAPLGSILSDYFERGKMLRALLVFTATSAVGGDPAQAIHGAKALELLHGAALVHDDIIDRARERRGRPALHVLIGTGPALVLGDYLILRSYAVLGQAESVRALEALNALSYYAQECCHGQVEELIPATGDPEEGYLSIVRGKTAAQFVAATAIGAILGGGSAAEMNALRAYAFNLGIAFQIRDDELDLTGEAAVMGKPTGKSLDNGRPMLPIIYLKKYGSAAAVQRYRLMRREGLPPSELVPVLESEGIFDRVRAVQETYLNQALEALDGLRTSREARAMAAIACYAISRTI